MRDLVPFVEMLQELAGGPADVGLWIQALQRVGVRAFAELGVSTDGRLVAERQARELGLVGPDGQPEVVRLAELTLVSDILARVGQKNLTATAAAPLVFTVPHEAEGIIAPKCRLDLLVADVIRDAVTSLHIGGPFWNSEGLELLRPVLEPALAVRQVNVQFFLSHSEAREPCAISAFIQTLGHAELITTWRYRGGQGSLMHAKFVVADGRRGYLGSANLTSFGLTQHVEVGVGLTAPQAQELLRLIDGLVAADFFLR